VIYQPATKPPLYNWTAAGVMSVSRSWGELAMKSPSVLGAIGVALVLWSVSWHGRPARVPGLHERHAHASPHLAIACLACAIWFSFGVEPRHGSVIRLLFLARPDMLQAFFLTAAWAAATCAAVGATLASPADADRPSSTGSPRATQASPLHESAVAMFFWLCVTGAILTKGPLALLVLVYAIVAARIVGGSWRAIARLRPVIGLLGTLAIVGSWFLFAYRTDAEHVRSVMLGAEIVGRVTSETPEGIAKPFWYSAMWFVTKGGPFAMLALAAIALLTMQKHRSRALEPVPLAAALWLVVLIVGLTLPAGKRIDYLLPTFAPASYLAAWLLVCTCRRFSVPVAVAALLPLWMSFTLARATLTKFHEARERWSDDAVTFARDVRSRVGDDEPLLVIVRGKHPLTTLLRRHQGSALDVGQLQRARWIVLPLIDTMARPVMQSELLPLGFETVETRTRGVIGLFDMQSPDRPTLEEVIAAQKQVATWTPEENPYRSPGTVWRE
jgi:4-amino-4-deoxy-L-arabinose transferase-like glycosyltransferase